ncbi:P1 family peptidase [Kineosporia succinea]|uniref:L-aminopeptidase/D-esterase-like protein n=1 Tax=Kineosporia succinea TaxID=84632 RepID=A0ABT9P551_9ACTN|nr:P1 family peptidase [Kineosporia succinea]MDP9827826.1 L-aminopeptidase/D-esterase-like protein [Kineosporia succinea]
MTHSARPAPLVPGRPVGNSPDLRLDSPGVGLGSVGLLEYDFPGVRIGTAEYPAGPTGCTVIEFPRLCRTAVDQRGGAVGMSGGFPWNHAVCLTGGSTFGLAAGTGVIDEMLRRGGYDVGFDRLPVVSSAVVYDFGPRDNAVHPDAELGRAALRNAVEGRAAFGRVGAGISTSVGKLDLARAEFAGQGVAFGQTGDASVLVVTVVNAVGVVVDRSGRVVRGNLDPDTGERSHPAAGYAAQLARGVSGPQPRGVTANTTITCVVTDVDLDDRELNQFARQVHGSMNRGIQPFNTGGDGDVLFAVTTGGVPPLPGTLTALGSVASELTWDAVLNAVV